MTRDRWIQTADALIVVCEVVIFIRIFTVHPLGEKGFDSALRVAGQTVLGFLVSLCGLAFAAFTMKFVKMQRWFGLASLGTTMIWGLLFLMASVDV